MECFSNKFTDAAIKALDSPNIIIGTITLAGTDFIHRVKKRDDIELTEVTIENRNELPDIILEKIKNISFL